MAPERPSSDPAAIVPHTEGLRRLARGLVRGDDLAGDVVQQTMLVALEAPPTS